MHFCMGSFLLGNGTWVTRFTFISCKVLPRVNATRVKHSIFKNDWPNITAAGIQEAIPPETLGPGELFISSVIPLGGKPGNVSVGSNPAAEESGLTITLVLRRQGFTEQVERVRHRRINR